MKVITVANQKGGAGKTTTVFHLAVQAEADGAGPVAMIDFDPQGSLSVPYKQREAETPVMARSDMAELPKKLKQLEEAGFKLVLIDTPPTDTPQLKRALEASDLVLIPMQASPLDLAAVGPTLVSIKELGRPFLFFMNRVNPRTLLCSQAIARLSKHGPVADTVIEGRTEYASALNDGRTMQEVNPRGKGAREIASLWAEVSGMISPTKKKKEKRVA